VVFLGQLELEAVEVVDAAAVAVVGKILPFGKLEDEKEFAEEKFEVACYCRV